MRRLLLIVVCTLFGASTTLAVALLLGNESLTRVEKAIRLIPSVAEVPHGWRVACEYHAPGLVLIETRVFPREQDAENEVMLARRIWGEELKDRVSRQPRGFRFQHSDWLDEYQMGWPLTCVRGVTAYYEPSTRFDGVLFVAGKTIPFHPIPLGLTLNTLFYASITGLLWFTFARTRASLRRRRGLCTRCKYNLSGLSPDPATSAITCPECGQAMTLPRI